MTEAQFPSGPSNVAQALQNASNTETNARAVSLPEAIEAQAKVRREAIKLTGEVVRNNDDGSVTVRTDRGDIDVKTDSRQQPPERGQRVEIEIPPQKANSRPQDVPVELRHAATEPSTQRSTSTPVNVEVRSDTAPPPPQQAPPPEQTAQAQQQQNLPAEGSISRLQPVAQQAVQSLPPVALNETRSNALPQHIEFQTQIVALEAVSQLYEELTNTLRAATPPTLDTAASITNLVTDLQSPAIVSLTEKSAPIPQGLPQSIANIVSSISRALPNVTGQNAETQSTSPRAFIESAALPASLSNIKDAAPFFTTNITPSTPQSLPLNTRPAPLDVRIDRIIPPAVTVSAPAVEPSVQRAINPYVPETTAAPENLITQNQGAPALTGIVTNITQEQLPVISVVFPQISSEQLFTLQFPTENVTIGTEIQVTPLTHADGSAAPNATSIVQNIPLTAVLQPAIQWPEIEDVIQTLARNAPQAAQSILNVTPSPSSPAQMSPAILFFVAAVRGGDLAQWLGDKAQNILKLQKSTKALSKLGGESQTLGRISSETFAQDWRAMNIPMLWQGDLHKVALYYKHDREQSDDEHSKINSTRFVFDLALENMGKVQLDGLFRPHSEAGTRLDLVVRTEELFSQATQGEMRRLYASALKDSQVTGELSFQNQPDSWVTIQAKHHDGLSVQS